MVKFKIGDILHYKLRPSYQERIIDIDVTFSGMTIYRCDVPNDEFAFPVGHDHDYLEQFFFKPNKFFKRLYGIEK